MHANLTAVLHYHANLVPGVSLRVKFGKWNRYLNLRDKDTQTTVADFTGSTPTGMLLELIVISCRIYLQLIEIVYCFSERLIEERPKDTELYGFYKVLWIEWGEGVAYRKGLGHVMKGEGMGNWSENGSISPWAKFKHDKPTATTFPIPNW
ncbi:hypothetical protein K432DRAFT_406992 [Lepidopterella palustris CBS 459.81]|uniref:Uncharacterized protein n=1 Tax=Lepidopterella palustris CBS 459.81 TaxID=1314670 RepID=A0A8E2E5L3_9PEZI|nr:hypothetical protein K432DRAFT_406992 [Lepidopterella palustris CBS 459.81]